MSPQIAYEETDAITPPIALRGMKREKSSIKGGMTSYPKSDTALDCLFLISQLLPTDFEAPNWHMHDIVGTPGPNTTACIDAKIFANVAEPDLQHRNLKDYHGWSVSNTRALKSWHRGSFSLDTMIAYSSDAATVLTVIPELQVAVPNRLVGYERYAKANWDYYGAEPITTATVDAARQFLGLLPDVLGEPHISPGADGTIGLEWVLTDKALRKLYIDIGPGKVWAGYWRLASNERHTILPKTIDAGSEAELLALFKRLNA